MALAPAVNPATTADATATRGELPAYRVRRVAQYIQDNVQREVRLAELSAVVHMSPYHFARLFKRSTGVSPHRFLVGYRIDQARVLLAAQTVPIAEIGRSVGFRTASHFTTTFRRFTGVTPSAYRSGASRGSSATGDQGILRKSSPWLAHAASRPSEQRSDSAH